MKMLIVRFNMFFWHDTTLQTDLSWWTDIFPGTTGYVIMHSNTNFTGHQFSIWNYFKKKKTYLPNSDMIQQIVLLQSTYWYNFEKTIPFPNPQTIQYYFINDFAGSA